MIDSYDCHGGPGSTEPACGACISCLHRIIENKDAQIAEANEYARKLSIKVTDLGGDIEQLKARNQQLKHVSDRFFKVREDLTIEEITDEPIVLYVEEVNGGMGPDYAEIYLATGHVIQVNDEGLLIWPSVTAYESGENDQILDGLAFESKEVKP